VRRFGGRGLAHALPRDWRTSSAGCTAKSVIGLSGPLRSGRPLVFTGHARASAIIEDHVKSVAIDMKQTLLSGTDRSWQGKRWTSNLISNSAVEEVFELGLQNGAVAGKVSGAAGGASRCS
jgi:hypothetical protein